MLRFVPDNPKTKKMCRHTVKKLSFIIKYVCDPYKTQKVCAKVILEMLQKCYKNQKIVIKLLVVMLMH